MSETILTVFSPRDFMVSGLKVCNPFWVHYCIWCKTTVPLLWACWCSGWLWGLAATVANVLVWPIGWDPLWGYAGARQGCLVGLTSLWAMLEGPWCWLRALTQTGGAGFFPYIFHLQLIEATDLEPIDTEGWLSMKWYCFRNEMLTFNSTWVKNIGSVPRLTSRFSLVEYISGHNGKKMCGLLSVKLNTPILFECALQNYFLYLIDISKGKNQRHVLHWRAR